MTYEGDQALRKLDQEIEDDRNARAELAWQLEPKSTDPMIELAERRGLPPGHVAFLGDKALRPFLPE